MIIGVDTLAGVKYPDIIAKLPKKYATGYFFEEFGNAAKQISNDLKNNRVFVRVQGLWAGKSHNYTDAHRKRAIEIARALNKTATDLNRTIYYSPFCEHLKDSIYMSALFNDIKKVAPRLHLVNSPIRGGSWVNMPGVVNEIHHNDKPAGMPKGEYIFSMDGLHQPDCDIEIYKKRHLSDPCCIAFYVWALQHNCKPNAKPENNIPPKQRKAKPTPDLDQSLIFQIENSKKPVKLAKGHILKTHSEQHNNVDPRANKLTYVGPKGARPKRVKVGKLNLIDSGFTPDKRPVFRSGKWAYKQGRVANVIVDGKLAGTVDQPFRENEWREKT